MILRRGSQRQPSYAADYEYMGSSRGTYHIPHTTYLYDITTATAELLRLQSLHCRHLRQSQSLPRQHGPHPKGHNACHHATQTPTLSSGRCICFAISFSSIPQFYLGLARGETQRYPKQSHLFPLYRGSLYIYTDHQNSGTPGTGLLGLGFLFSELLHVQGVLQLLQSDVQTSRYIMFWGCQHQPHPSEA